MGESSARAPSMEARIASGDVEAEVIRRAQAGDPEAIGWLYDRYYLPIYRYLRVRVEDQEAAEDLAAEVFVRMIEHLPRYQSRGRPFLAWLYTIARNLLTDYYRSQRWAPLDLPDPERGRGDEGMMERIEARAEQDCLWRALRQLTPEQQEVLFHRFFEGRSVEETAQLMGKQPGAIRALQHRALAALRRRMEEMGCR
ncbi:MULTISPECIES: sigma-70 family RNA polymerase sigma factor [Thermoflexus]|jgi:RNA polymerase sigma-70 factor (ECF subfamily)|uniref:sigma-70 family RNA polymerase sigma factor n=2 Tax=Thermoflexaceae TaxID=1495648 RepID=UPI001C7992CD|nr:MULTISPECIES: sigma-70 family RNA polymerase sigma factor [Thermoflexus]MDT7949441.1 sigma-70 family RNA polymerase sigma factor [Thermoflexus sp.]QWK11195.1 MAG: sigma-70 family RNA polymerase sigma factor [Thermoflexus hugenholtzii]